MKKAVETKYYMFATTSRKPNQRSGDCVIRSISLALDKTWNEVYDSLCEIGRDMCRVPNEDKVYEKYLTGLGFTKQKQLRKDDNTKYTAREFAENHRKGTYIVRLSHHLTCIKDGKIHDTWNCGEWTTGNYYKVK